MSRTHAYVLCQVAGWTLLLAILWILSGRAVSLPQGACQIAAAGFCSHALRRVIQRGNWLSLSWSRLLSRVALASLIAGATVTFFAALTYVPQQGLQILSTVSRWLPGALWNWSFAFFLWCVFYFGIHYFESYHASKDAQLQALLLQLNPHFLFNCLNSLRALIVENPVRAQAMVTEMSELLRYSLQSTTKETIALGEELDAVSAYLRLESIRFEDRLQVQIQVDESVRATRIPPMLVQILVENAIKHGISNLREGGVLRITSQCEAGALKLRVSNSGQLAESSHTTKMGLNNARKRLKLQYRDRASLRIANDGPHHVLAEVSVPL